MAIALILGADGLLKQVASSEALQADKFERKSASGDLLVGSDLGADELQLGSDESLVRSMGDLEVDGYAELEDTSAPGNPLDGAGRLYKKTGDDGLFWIADSGGDEVDLTLGMSAEAHRGIDQLTHGLDEDYFEEYTYTIGGNVANSIAWTDAGKTKKIREYDYTYAGGKMTQSVERQFDGAGALAETLTKTYAWSGSRLTSVTCARS